MRKKKIKISKKKIIRAIEILENEKYTKASLYEDNAILADIAEAYNRGLGVGIDLFSMLLEDDKKENADDIGK